MAYSGYNLHKTADVKIAQWLEDFHWFHLGTVDSGSKGKDSNLDLVDTTP